MTNNDQSFSLTIDLHNGPALCRADADWIVEDFFDSKGGNSVPFARFQDLWFEDVRATTTSGKAIGLDGASMIDLGSSVADSTCVAQPYDNSNFWCQSQG